MRIKKRDARVEEFSSSKLIKAISKCFDEVHNTNQALVYEIANSVQSKISDNTAVETIQDLVEQELVKRGMYDEAKAYIIYRHDRAKARDANTQLTKIFDDINKIESSELDLKRENANIDANTSMGTMLKIGTEASKDYNLKYLIKPKFAMLHENGDYHIHDLDFYSITMNCLFIPLAKLLKSGFNTGHGTVREPQSIHTAANLACIVLQSNQNEMFGGQAFPTFDYDLAPYVGKSFVNHLRECLNDYFDSEDTEKDFKNILTKEITDKIYQQNKTILNDTSKSELRQLLPDVTTEVFEKMYNRALVKTDKETYQAMEALIHNFNTMHSRCLPADEKVITLNVKKSKDIDKLSDTEREAFKDLIENLYSSMTIKEVAAELNISCKVMCNLFNKLGVKIRNKKETAEFMKTRWIEKYGVDNPAKNSEILKKIRDTQFKKYGCYGFNTEKQKQTMIERYGTPNCMQNEDVKNKLFNTNIKKYGCKCTLQAPEVIEKSKKTCLERYGVHNVLCKNSPLRPSNIGFDKNLESNKKAHKTLQEKYGGSGMGSLEIKEKITKTCMKKYGHVTYPVYKDSYGLHESKGQIELYNIIKNKYHNVDVIKNQRGLLLENEGLEIDIWIPQLRIGIEYNGDYWHDRNTYEDDIINNNVTTRERIKDILAANNNITLIQIWESDFKSNKKDVLDYIFSIIDEHLEG